MTFVEFLRHMTITLAITSSANLRVKQDFFRELSSDAVVGKNVLPAEKDFIF